MRVTLLCILIGLLATACGSETTPEGRSSGTEAPAGPVDVTITFHIENPPDAALADSPRPVLQEFSTTALSATKAGRPTLRDAWQDETPDDERSARHRYPPGCTARAVAGYYLGMLANAGWKKDEDFRLNDATLTLLGVEAATARVIEGAGLSVNVTSAPAGAAPPRTRVAPD